MAKDDNSWLVIVLLIAAFVAGYASGHGDGIVLSEDECHDIVRHYCPLYEWSDWEDDYLTVYGYFDELNYGETSFDEAADAYYRLADIVWDAAEGNAEIASILGMD
ncbi:MAG: hypothetical protein IJB41_07150 [Clostridia bacterium]|nr:hypothetical protein [Clostridia bacterium]